MLKKKLDAVLSELKVFDRIREIKTLTFPGTKQKTFQTFVERAATFPLGV